MKRLMSLFFCLAICQSSAFAADVVNMAIGEWAPFTSEKDPKGKLTEKVVTEAYKLEGVDVKFSYFPWKRSSTMVEEGASDASFPWNRTDAREAIYIYHKVPVLSDDGVYFHLKGKPFDWNTIQDLKKYKVGVTVGYKNEQGYKDLGIPADAAPSEEMNFKKMLAGRIDVYQTSKTVGWATINKHFTPEEAKQFTTHPKNVAVDDYFVIFSKKNPNSKALADKLDSGMKKLKASGAYDKIMSQ